MDRNNMIEVLTKASKGKIKKDIKTIFVNNDFVRGGSKGVRMFTGDYLDNFGKVSRFEASESEFLILKMRASKVINTGDFEKFKKAIESTGYLFLITCITINENHFLQKHYDKEREHSVQILKDILEADLKKYSIARNEGDLTEKKKKDRHFLKSTDWSGMDDVEGEEKVCVFEFKCFSNRYVIYQVRGY